MPGKVDDIIWPLLLGLKTSLAARLTAWGHPAVRNIAIVGGSQITYDFDEKGYGRIRLTRAFESTTFPVPSPPTAPCGAPLAAEVEVAVVRCGAKPKTSPTGSVSLPPPSEEEAVASLLAADMRAMHDAIIAVGGKPSIYTPSPPGPMVGGAWLAFLGEE